MRVDLRNRFRFACLSVSLATSPLLATGCDDEASGLTIDGGADAAPVGTPDAAVACGVAGAPGPVTLVAQGLPDGVAPIASLISGSTVVPLAVGTATPVNPGLYQVSWKRVKVAPGSGELIGKAHSVSNVAWTAVGGCVTAGAPTTLTVTYTMEPGSNKAWVNPANGAGEVLAFDESQLRAGGMQSPTVIRQMGITQGRDLAFDLQGNLWVSDTGVGGGLLAYPMATLGTAADRPPSTKLTGAGALTALAFDAEGNLWAGQRVPGGQDLVVKLAAAQLAVATTTTTTMRAVTPALTITTPMLGNPTDVAFDAAGNLWVASGDSNQLLGFTAAQLASGGAIAPAVILKASKTIGGAANFRSPENVTFDSAGNLWSSWLNVLMKFTPTQLGASATIMDAPILEPMGQGGAGVSTGTNAFDATGGLWMSRTNLGSAAAALVRVPAAGVAAGGEQATMPNLISTALGNGVDRIVFNPTPPGLPIRD